MLNIYYEFIENPIFVALLNKVSVEDIFNFMIPIII